MLNFRYFLCVFTFIVTSARCETKRRKVAEDNLDIDLESMEYERQLEQPVFETPDKDWIVTALRDIAYNLRNYKFNEWDRRYYNRKLENASIGFHGTFPMPPLRALHWKVFENCKTNFYKCITYMHSIIKMSPLKRQDDVVTIMNTGQSLGNGTFSKLLHSECNEALLYSEKTGAPFDGPVEKFQWRTTASYYMCWYTMLEQPDLVMLGEPCDNHANCLHPGYGPHNRDPRSDDRLFFACATYSFCPDICCPTKHFEGYSECYENEMNPCHLENSRRSLVEKVCLMNRKDNRNFNDIVKNRWNISCSCANSGFVWKSEYSMCVDINECTTGTHTCNAQNEDCLNLPGKFMCICKWGFRYDDRVKQCRIHNIFNCSTIRHAKNVCLLIKLK